VNDSIAYEDLAEKAYKSIKEMILSGALAPGEKLGQAELSKRLGVSRTPLAAAFSKLEKEMLVEFLPRRGGRVRRLSHKELVDLYDVRLNLEPLGAAGAAAAVASGSCPPAVIQEALAVYQGAIDSGLTSAIKRADYVFHLLIMQMSGNEALYRIVSSFNIVFICNQRGLLKPALQSLAEHQELAAAIAAGDPAATQTVMLGHLTGARANLVAHLEGGAG